MKAKRQMNELAKANIFPIHGGETKPMDAEPKASNEWTFWGRRALEAGIIMANTETPRGWNFNPTNIGVLLSLILFFFAVCGSIGGAAWYLSAQANQIQALEKKLDDATKGAYEKGKADAEKKQLEERLQILEKEKQAEEFMKRR
jgi:hypothetical protein